METVKLTLTAPSTSEYAVRPVTGIATSPIPSSRASYYVLGRFQLKALRPDPPTNIMSAAAVC